MGLKVEKRFGRQELADFLADLSNQVQSGQLKGESRAWTVPEQVEGTIHLKEEEGEVVAKIKLSWPSRGGSPTAPGEMAPQESISFKAVKARLSTSFKELQRLIRQGTIPDTRTMQDFVTHSRAFAELARPEWQELMAEFMANVEKLQQAAADGQIEAMQRELQMLVDRLKVCHREFKK